MRRDMDLLRLLMLELEAVNEGAHSIIIYEYSDFEVAGYTEDQITYHLMLAVEAGLVEQGGSGTMSGFMFQRLSWAGHDFVDSVRDEEIWRKTRQGAGAAGGFTLELLTDLAKGFIRKKIADHTGIQM